MPEKLIIIQFQDPDSDDSPSIEVHVCPLTILGAVLKSLNKEGFCLFRQSSGLMLSRNFDLYGLEDGEHLIGIRNTWVDDLPDD